MTVTERMNVIAGTSKKVYNDISRLARVRKAVEEPGMSTQDRYAFLRRVAMFDEMDEEELAALARDFRRRTFGAGESIFYQGDPGNAVYVVERGTVRIYVHADEGQEVAVVIYGPGEVFGEMSLLDQLPRSATAEAIEETVLWVMNAQDFDRHLRTSHQLALNVMLTLSTRLRQTNESVKSLASLDVTRRVAKRLLSLALRQGVQEGSAVRINSRLTQGDLASLVGTSRESANRALRALQRKGLIDMEGGYITIREPGELSSLVGGEETWW